MADPALWQHWWIWMAAGVVLVILEMFAPGFVMLGFGIGAFAVGLLFVMPGGVMGSLPVAMLVFGLLSLIAWLVLRRVFKLSNGTVKIWDKDINDN